MVFCVSYRRHLYWYVVADDHFALLSLLQLWIYVCNPCCFLYLIPSYLVSSPSRFKISKSNKGKKKLLFYAVVFNSTEKTKSKVDRDSKSTVSREKRGILKNVKKLGWRICRMNKLTSFWFIRKKYKVYLTLPSHYT